MNPNSVLRVAFRLPFLLFSLCCAAAAPAVGTGTIEGRVLNPSTGEYLEFVRVTVEGTSLETFTDSAGQYRLTGVPAGTATVTAFRTGLAAGRIVVTVGAAAVAVQNFDLGEPGTKPGAAGGETIKLAQFVVSTSKEMDGAAIAINTQRFAPNTMNVIAANEFGPVADGGVGEVLKSVPGVEISRGGFGDAFTISMDGVPSGNVPVTVGGINLANAASGTQRTVGLNQVSINSFSRIEVIHTPTPETSGSALAGSVNLVPISAFERSRPVYNLSVSLMMRDNARDWGKTPGPTHLPGRKIHPGVDFSAIVPVNDRFGFTITGSASTLYTATDFSQNGWRGGGLPTNGTAFPDTTTDRPYLTNYLFRDRPVLSKRHTFGATVDYKFGRFDRISLSLQYGNADSQAYFRETSFVINSVQAGGFTSTSTRGVGDVLRNNQYQKLGGPVVTPSLNYRHDGLVWKSELGLGLSRSGRYNQNVDRGSFNSVQSRLPNVAIAFDDIFYLRPGRIGVTNTATGASIDPFDLSNFSLVNATGTLLKARSTHETAFGNIRRDFFTRIPVAVKAGFDFRRTTLDTRTYPSTYAVIGGGGVSTNAASILDESFSERTAPFGFSRVQVMSNQELYSLFAANPGAFTLNAVQQYTGTVTNSKYADEAISAGYVRGDVQLFDRRLKLVGGLRAEQTNVEGQGALVDSTRNFQRNPATGAFILGSNGRPLPIATDPLAVAQLTNIDRGLQAEKEYLRWFPSLNASFNVRENFIVRAGYYHSVGRPDFAQYAGALTLPDISEPASSTNVTRVSNAGIKAWSARSLKVTLEYYFERVGLISVSAFQRNISNAFESATFRPSSEFLALYGLEPSIYGGFDVVTQRNNPGTVRMSGYNVNYKQALTFLPQWARGVQVFANGTAQRVIGDDTGSFTGYVPRLANWGVSFTRPSYNVRMNWNYNGRKRQGLVAAGRGIEPGTYTWASKRMIVDLSAEYYFFKRTAVWMNLTNLTDSPADLEIAGPNTPDRAQFRQRTYYGAMWLFGLKTSF